MRSEPGNPDLQLSLLAPMQHWSPSTSCAHCVHKKGTVNTDKDEGKDIQLPGFKVKMLPNGSLLYSTTKEQAQKTGTFLRKDLMLSFAPELLFYAPWHCQQ